MNAPVTTSGKAKRPHETPRFLAYALPRAKGDHEARLLECNGYTIHDLPQGSLGSFLDYDGVVVFGGSFETVRRTGYQDEIVCRDTADLDRREREMYTLLQDDKPLILLLHYLPKRYDSQTVDYKTDLFRRVTSFWGINWASSEYPSPIVKSLPPEFQEYVSRHGSGYISLDCKGAQNDFLKPLCTSGETVYGASIADKVFLIPCVDPHNTGQVQEIITTIVGAVIAYRSRVAREVPQWVSEFGFTKEQELKSEFAKLQQHATRLKGEISTYGEWKGALVFQSDPLVEVIVRLSQHFFNIVLTVDEKKIEDATIRDSNGQIIAIGEIKGVNGNVKRTNINQVDSHRERLGLPANTPGFLIMNSMMAANSLAEKDEPPHPDIIRKAVADHVLFIRTLDLLRFADGVERGVFDSKQLYQHLIGSGRGWFRVREDQATLVTE